ncbi:cysteine desulfurase family protein [Paenibacillus physcomitrellae]|uniref:Aminotransferase V n=1 Tax=Paenibacillus physcomitrellae TaxID=1619311 RepID=A0ABQ1FKY8_9BACL|nr:cysteine desulfurase family protein [Paenibacillus physcomitrellae]GGA20621.1 aminotransferase V [Paenibacillus physcomitrellae]
MKYFDHAASTPPHPEVIRTIAEVMQAHYGNPSSLHASGESGFKLLHRAREVCAQALGVEPSEIVFTSGATESNNMAIKGAALQYRTRGKHLITSMVEHPSVYESFRQLEGLGFEVTFVPVQTDGTVDIEAVMQAVRKDTVLVSIMHVNNETGSIQPVAEIGRELKQKHPRVLFHVDGVQGFGKVPLQIKDSGIDLYSLSAHKIRGPKGAGLLYVRKGVQLFPLLSGGGQEGGVRSGTENVPALVGMAKALRLAKEKEGENIRGWRNVRQRLVEGMASLPELVLNSPADGAPHILHFSYPGMKPEVVLHCLEEDGLEVSTKSACSSKTSEPSRVLLAMGKSMEVAQSGIRISLGDEHTAEDADLLIEALTKAVKRLSGLKGGLK